MVLRTFILTILLFFSGSSNAAPHYDLKFATLMPAGTAWSKTLDD